MPHDQGRSRARPAWRLRTSAASPYGRKIRLAIAALGLTDCVQIEPANTSDPNDSLRRQNPLGKIPILLLEDGTALFDSRVIVDYLDLWDGRAILVPQDQPRHLVLRQQALADGLLDAALLQVYEARHRPEALRVPEWLAYQQEKIDRALDAFGADLPLAGRQGPHIGEIALAAALGYLDLRFEGRWRTTHPALAHWLASLAQRFPAMAAAPLAIAQQPA